MATSFSERFDEHGVWRREFASRLRSLGAWMKEHQLMDSSLEGRVKRLEHQLRTDKVMVAFVAEFSRGKSELINAIFFATYGRRLMPTSAGRTTMCPTELAYVSDVPACLRLLPIDSRLEPMTLAEWRERPQQWTQVDLDVRNATQLAEAFAKVAEVRKVTQAEARSLGFWHDQLPEDNPLVDAQGMVEVPRWRHALINIAHPLLRQGLIILDTPGLNAIGAEPELTVNLIPQAHAVVFILAADAGVTKSDLAVWREHLSPQADNLNARVVVLNKIDTLWDALSTPEQVQAQIERQRTTSAEVLGIAPDQVIAVSAQKGLVAKITSDDVLLQASRLPELEAALSSGIMEQREHILRAAVAKGVGDLRSETLRVINIRRRDLAEQKLELKGLGGKNTAVIRNMRLRIEQERQEFDAGDAKIQAVRAVQQKLLGGVFALLGARVFTVEFSPLAEALRQKGLKLGVKKVYAQAFDRLRDGLSRAQTSGAEIQAMLAATFRQLNAEYSFSLQVPAEPDLQRYRDELSNVERSHLQYFSMGQVFRLAQPEFAERLAQALASRLRAVYDSAFADVELWSKSASAQLEAQLRERRKSFTRRMEAIDRIHQASGGLQERVAEIEADEALMDLLDGRLEDLTSYFITGNDSDYAPTGPMQVA